jgi:hypothetical protein
MPIRRALPRLVIALALACLACPLRGLVSDAIVYVARLDATADSALAHDPSGRVLAQTYTVKVWHPDADEIARTVKVPASGDVALDVAL